MSDDLEDRNYIATYAQDIKIQLQVKKNLKSNFSETITPAAMHAPPVARQKRKNRAA